MRTEENVKEKMAQLKQYIDRELDTGTNDPTLQWAALKMFHAQVIMLEWVLEDREVS